jgi:hypothetical protein
MTIKHRVLLAAGLSTAVFIKLFFICLQDEVASWESCLSRLVEGLGLLQGIQRRWL